MPKFNPLDELYALLYSKDDELDINTINEVIHHILPNKTIINDGKLIVLTTKKDKIINGLISLFHLKTKQYTIKLFLIYIILAIIITSIIILILSYKTNIYKYNQDRYLITIGIALILIVLLLSISFALKIKFSSSQEYKIFLKFNKKLSLSSIKSLNNLLKKKNKEDLRKLCIEYAIKITEKIKKDDIENSEYCSIFASMVAEEREKFELLLKKIELLFSYIKDKFSQPTELRNVILTSEEQKKNIEKVTNDLKLLGYLASNIKMIDIKLQELKMNIKHLLSLNEVNALHRVVRNLWLEDEYIEKINQLNDEQKNELINETRSLIEIIKDINGMNFTAKIAKAFDGNYDLKKNKKLHEVLGKISALLHANQKEFNFIDIDILIKLLDISLSNDDREFIEEESKEKEKQAIESIQRIFQRTQHTKTLCAIIDEIASFNQEKKGKLKKDLNWFAESSGKFTPRFNELMHRLKMIINNDYLQRTDGIRDIISDLLLKLKREVEEMSQSDCIDRQYILEKIEEVLSYMNAVYHTPIEIVKQNNELIVKLAILIEKIKLDTRSRAEMQDMQSLSHQIHIHNPSQFGTAEDQLKELQASVVGLIESDEIMHNLSSLQSNKTLKVQIRSSTINALQTKISNISDELTKLHETTFHVLEKLNTAFNASNHLKTSDILPKIILLQKLLQEMKRIHHIVENSNFSKISNQELTAEINKLHTLNEINKQYYQKINSQLLHVILLTLDRQSYIMLNSTTNDLRATASNIIEYYQRELICPVHLPGSLNKLSRLFIPFMSPSILSAQG